MIRGVGTALLFAGKAYVWTINDAGQLEAIPLERALEAMDVPEVASP